MGSRQLAAGSGQQSGTNATCPLPTAGGRVSTGQLAEYEERLALIRGAKAGKASAIKTLWDRYHVRVVPVEKLAGGSGQQAANNNGENPMDEHHRHRGAQKPFPQCGRMLWPAGYGRHVPRCTGTRQGGGGRQGQGQGQENATASATAASVVMRQGMLSVEVKGLPVPTLPEVVERVREWRDDCDATLRVLSQVMGA